MKFIVRYIFSTCIALTCLLQVNAQPKIVDSLAKESKKSINDSVSIFLLVQMATKTFVYDSVKALNYLESAYKMAKKLHWDYAYGSYYENKVFLKQMNMDNDAAALCFDSAINYYQQSVNTKHNKKEVSDATLSIANCKGEKGEVLVPNNNTKKALQNICWLQRPGKILISPLRILL